RAAHQDVVESLLVLVDAHADNPYLSFARWLSEFTLPWSLLSWVGAGHAQTLARRLQNELGGTYAWERQHAALPAHRRVRVRDGHEGPRSDPRRARSFAETSARTDRAGDPCGLGRTSRTRAGAEDGTRRAVDVMCRESPGKERQCRGLRQRGQDRD